MAQTPTETIKNYYKPLIRFIDNSIKNDGGELPNFKSDLQEILDQFNPTNFAIYSITSDIMYTIRQALMADKKITALSAQDAIAAQRASDNAAALAAR